MIGSSTLEARCTRARVWNMTGLSTWSSIRGSSSEARVSSSVSIESGPIEVHGNRNIVHAPWSIGRVVLRIIRLSHVKLVLIKGTVIIPHVTKGVIIGLGSSLLEIVLEVSKRSSSKPRARDEGGSVALSGLVSLRTLSEDIL